MPEILAQLAGGVNVFNDIKDSYVRVGWEAIIARDPEWIIVHNHRIPPEEIIQYLTTNPLLQDISAVKNRNFVLMTYSERTPSTQTVIALERLAKAMHPELFAE